MHFRHRPFEGGVKGTSPSHKQSENEAMVALDQIRHQLPEEPQGLSHIFPTLISSPSTLIVSQAIPYTTFSPAPIAYYAARGGERLIKSRIQHELSCVNDTPGNEGCTGHPLLFHS